MLVPPTDALHQLANGLGLVTLRLERSDESKLIHVPGSDWNQPVRAAPLFEAKP